MGLMTVRGCNHRGIASTGLKAPDNVERGGLMKKLVSKACCADLLRVAMTVPMLIPDRTQSAAAVSTSARLPRKGTWKANLMTMIASSAVMSNRTKSGVILAMMISAVLAGAM